MRITDVKVSGLHGKVPPMAHKDQSATSRWDIVLIRVLTDEGIEGNAFGYGIRSGEITARLTVELLKPALVGEDPLDREKIWQKIRTLDRWLALFPIYAQGPIDVALWDIAGKAAGMPLSEADRRIPRQRPRLRDRRMGDPRYRRLQAPSR